MKKLTFHISHLTLHTLILLAGVMMFTSCSDDNNNSNSLPFFMPNVHWGDTKDAVKNAMNGCTFVSEKDNFIQYEGKAPVDYYTLNFLEGKLSDYYLYLQPSLELKEKILNYINANYKPYTQPEAKTRSIPYEDFKKRFVSKDGKTGLIFSDSQDEDGSTSFYSLRFFDYSILDF